MVGNYSSHSSRRIEHRMEAQSSAASAPAGFAWLPSRNPFVRLDMQPMCWVILLTRCPLSLSTSAILVTP